MAGQTFIKKPIRIWAKIKRTSSGPYKKLGQAT